MERPFRVDWIRCDGFGLCGDLVPDLIDLDECRYPILRQGPIGEDRIHDAQRAVDCCPMQALFLEPASADRRPGDGPRAPALGVRLPGRSRSIPADSTVPPRR